MSINGLNWRDGKTIHKMSSVNATDYKTTAVCLGTKTIAKKPPPLPAMVALNMFEGMNPIAAILAGKDKERKKKRNKNFRKGRNRKGRRRGRGRKRGGKSADPQRSGMFDDVERAGKDGDSGASPGARHWGLGLSLATQLLRIGWTHAW